MAPTQFGGSIVASITPFKDGEIDFEAWEKFVEWQIAEGTQAIVPCGTTGESATFSHEEQHRAIEWMVRTVRGRIPVLAGAGSNSTREAVDLARHAEKSGADGILSVVPYYNKPTQQGIYLHYREIRNAVKLPIVLYNVPARTVVNMQTDTVRRIWELSGIDSVKEASGNLGQCQDILNRGIRILSGEDGLTFPIMAIGGSGVISVVANFAPRIIRDLCDATTSGNLVEARRIHRIVHELSEAAFVVTNPIPAKTAVAMLGFCREEFRLPLTPMRIEDNRGVLISALRKHGIVP